MKERKIELKNATKIIKGKKVLDKISLELLSGTVYGIRGINGSGKTMLMRLISGLIYPTEGSVVIDGKILGKEVDFPEKLGLLIEHPAFLEDDTGRKNLEWLGFLQENVGKEEIENVMRKVGLDPKDKRKYRKYSLGMKQRLGLATVILGNPDILIFDEPLNALDKEGIALFDTILQEEKRKGKLILVSCHDKEKLEEYAEVIFTMEEGRIVSEEKRR